MDDRESKAYISKLFQDRYGLALDEIPEKQNERTPDFECVEKGERIFVAELKTYFRQEPSASNGWEIEQDGDLSVALKLDNAASRVGNSIVNASVQLNGYDCLKILIILNFEYIDSNDIRMVVDGFLTYYNQAGREVLEDSSGATHYRAREAMRKMDLITFIDPQKKHIFCKYLNDAGKLFVKERLKVEV